MKTMDNNRQLREQRGNVLKEAKALSSKGKLNAIDQKKFDSLMAEAEEIRAEIEALENRGGSTETVLGGRIGGGFESRNEDPKQKEHRRAFGQYLRRGISNMDPAERSVLEQYRSTLETRDMGTGGQGAYPGATGSLGGFFVPVGFVLEIIEAMKTTGPLLDEDKVRMMTTATGQPLPIPAEDDTAVIGERIGEGQQVTTQDLNLSMIMLGSYKYSSRMVKVSIELLQDSAFDLEAHLISSFAKRLGRALVSDFTFGTGSANSQPMGIITSTLANGNLVAAVGSSANDGTSASTNTIGSDDLINLEHSIDPLYRPGASYMMNDLTFRTIRRVKDKYGRPLYEAPLIAGGPPTIGGYPVYINNYMDTLQTQASSPQIAKNTVLFGDLRRFVVRRVKEMSVLSLVERFADMGQTAYIAFCRYDSSPLFGGTGTEFPFGLLQNHY
jgi:HK97 family phage major capsid protein